MEKIIVFWTKNATNDLQAIHEYISRDSIFYADRFIENLILSTTQQLSISPNSGRSIPEFKNTIINFLSDLIYRNYRIIYRFHKEKNQVNIIAVMNAKRDLPKHTLSWEIS